IAYRVVGASCPGVLDIYQYENGRIEKITGGWSDTCQSDVEIKDLNGDGIQEILFRTLKYGRNREIYRWDGKQFIRSDREFAQHYSDDLEKLLQYINSRNPLPASARVSLCEQAVQIYKMQGRFSEAIQLCENVQQMINDPTLTTPGTILKGDETNEQRSRIE